MKALIKLNAAVIAALVLSGCATQGGSQVQAYNTGSNCASSASNGGYRNPFLHARRLAGGKIHEEEACSQEPD